MNNNDTKIKLLIIRAKKQELIAFLNKEVPIKNNIDISAELKRTKSRISLLIEILIKGYDKSKLSQLEADLINKKSQLEQMHLEREESLQSSIKATSLNINNKEDLRLELNKNFYTLDKEYNTLLEKVSKLSDNIVDSEANGGTADSSIRDELAELIKHKTELAEQKRKLQLNLEELDAIIKDLNASLNKQLATSSKELLMYNKRLEELEKTLAFTTAKRDFLIDKYETELKNLDYLNILSFKNKYKENILKRIKILEKEEALIKAKSKEVL